MKAEQIQASREQHYLGVIATERDRADVNGAGWSRVAKALRVMTQTRAIREWLEANDPKALAQALEALGERPIKACAVCGEDFAQVRPEDEECVRCRAAFEVCRREKDVVLV